MRWWCRFVQPTEDHRPLTFPPNPAILGWWCSGYKIGGEMDLPILCALIEAADELAVAEAIRKDWPEAYLGDVDAFIKPVAADYLPGDRFPLDDWMRARASRRPDKTP